MTPVDRGYAWVILCASCFVYMILFGSVKSFGILYTEFLQKYETGAGNTAWIGSIQFFFFFAIAPLSNSLTQRFSFRKVMMFGGWLISAGYFISAFIPHIEWIYLTLGIVAGFGGGMANAPCITIANFYFEKRRAFANGCVIAGSGLGSFIFPYLYRFLIDTFGLHGALMIIGGINLHICVAGALLRQPDQLKNVLEDNHTESNGQQTELSSADVTTNQSTKLRKRLNFDFSLLRNTKVMINITAFTVQVFAYAATFSVFPVHAKSIDIGNEKVAIALSMVGVTEIIARPFFGWLADQTYFKTTIIMFASVVCGTSALIIPFFRNFPAMIVYGCIVGIFPGAFWSLIAVVMLECVERNRLASALGLLYMFMSLSIAISQPIMGWIEDATGSWDLSFRVMGVAYYCSGAILFLQGLTERFGCCKHGTFFTKQKEISEEESTEPEKLIQE